MLHCAVSILVVAHSSSEIPVGLMNNPVLLTPYFSGVQIKNNEMDGACGTYGEGIGVYRIFVGKSDGKRPLSKTQA